METGRIADFKQYAVDVDDLEQLSKRFDERVLVVMCIIGYASILV